MTEARTHQQHANNPISPVSRASSSSSRPGEAQPRRSMHQIDMALEWPMIDIPQELRSMQNDEDSHTRSNSQANAIRVRHAQSIFYSRTVLLSISSAHPRGNTDHWTRRIFTTYPESFQTKALSSTGRSVLEQCCLCTQCLGVICHCPECSHHDHRNHPLFPVHRLYYMVTPLCVVRSNPLRICF